MSSGRSNVPPAELLYPLVDCLKCPGKVIGLYTKAGGIFYKCKYHDREDSTSCDQYWVSEGSYYNHLKTNFPQLVAANNLQPPGIRRVTVEPRQSNAVIPSRTLGTSHDLLNQISELKCANCALKMELCELKIQNGEMRGHINEMKTEFGAQINEMKNEIQYLNSIIKKAKVGQCNWGGIAIFVVVFISFIVGWFLSAFNK